MEHSWIHVDTDYNEYGCWHVYECPRCGIWVSSKEDEPTEQDVLEDGYELDCDLEKVKQVMAA